MTINEIGNTYVDDTDRFVVSLVVGYGAKDGVRTARQALAAAIELTRDGGADGTHWYVYDRRTGTMQMIEQGQVSNVQIR